MWIRTSDGKGIYYCNGFFMKKDYCGDDWALYGICEGAENPVEILKNPNEEFVMAHLDVVNLHLERVLTT